MLATAEKIFGADLSPNGSARSMYVLPIHEIAMIFWVNWYHAICILRSILTSSVLRPRASIHSTASSTDA